MGVRLVVDIWGQTVAEGSIAGADAFNQPSLHQKLQDAIHCHPVDLLDIVEFPDDFLSTQRMRPVANDFQDAQSIYRVAQAAMFK